MNGADLSALAGKSPAMRENDAIIDMSRQLIALIADQHGDDDDLGDGLSLNVIRNEKTHQVISVHITPVDMVDGQAIPRYDSMAGVTEH